MFFQLDSEAQTQWRQCTAAPSRIKFKSLHSVKERVVQCKSEMNKEAKSYMCAKMKTEWKVSLNGTKLREREREREARAKEKDSFKSLVNVNRLKVAQQSLTVCTALLISTSIELISPLS